MREKQMGVEKVRGIILKERPSGESGVHLLVLTKERGKILLSARGARKPKSKLLAGTQLFCYGDYYIYQGKGFDTITQVDIRESFFGLREDFDRLTRGVYLLDLVERTSLEGADLEQVLQLLLQTLWVMAKKKVSPDLAVRIFELKYLQLCGVMPVVDSCSVCASPLEEPFCFSVNAGGMVCHRHRIGETFSISAGARKAMQYVFEHEKASMFRFRVSPVVLAELGRLLGYYMDFHLHVHLKSRDFIASLKE